MSIFDFLKRKKDKGLVQYFPYGFSLYLPMANGEARARGFLELARAGYFKNMTVFSCVKLIASSIASLDPLLYRQDKNGKEEIETHEILDLLQRPSSDYMSFEQFMEAAASYLLLAGNAYILKLRAGEKGKPKALTLLRPDLVTVQYTNEITEYRYQIGNQTVRYTPDDIIHVKEFNPLHPFLGVSRLEIAMLGVEVDNEAHIWNSKLLKNNMRLEGIFKTNQQLTPEQIRSLQESLKDFEGYLNAGRHLILQAGLEWEQISISPKDMDWVNAIKMNRREICAVFGVPPELLGDSEQKTYSNYQEARKAFYEETIIPLANIIFTSLSNGLCAEWDRTLYLTYDRDNIEALQENRAERYNYIDRAWWISLNEKREATGYSPVPGGDSIMIPANLIPTVNTEPVKAQGVPAVKKEAPAIITPTDITRWRNKSERDSLWYSFYDRVKAKEKGFIPLLENYLESQTRRAIERIKELGTVRMAARATELLDVKDEAKRYHKLTEEIYLKHFAHGFRAGISATKGLLYEYQEKGVLDEMTDEEAEKLAHLIFDSGTKISRTTLERIKEKIIRADQENWTVEQLTQAIWESEGIFAPWRARMIARTESAKIENWAQLEGYKETEFVDGKGWLSARIKTSRDEHIEAANRYEDNPIRLEEKFLVGGEELEYPGDPSGSPGNVINCLCSIFPAVLK